MVIAAAVLLNLFFRIIRLPLKWLVKAALHAAVGFVALFILNFIGSWIGVPGVLILLVIKYIL